MAEATAASWFAVARWVGAASRRVRAFSIRAYIVGPIVIVFAPLLGTTAYLAVYSAVHEPTMAASRFQEREALLYAPVWLSILVLLGGITLTLVELGIVRRIARAVAALADLARTVGCRDQIALIPTGILEADLVVQSLHIANERLWRSAQKDALVLRDALTLEEHERRRIARELHDSLGQYLTVLSLGFVAIEPLCTTDERTQRCLTELKKGSRDLGRELSRIAWELYPLVLDDLGLRRAVTQCLEEWSERMGLQIDLEMGLDDRPLPQLLKTTLLRALQELFAEVEKHSGAKRASVILQTASKEIQLIVEDDGHSSDSDRHPGLLGMRERLKFVAGRAEAESSMSGGTTAYVTIPMWNACSELRTDP
jgi:signal transduction histidine kinase